MQGFAARTLLVLGLTVILHAPSAAQNRTSSIEPDVLIQTGPTDSPWKAARFVSEIECKMMCEINPECTAWTWRNWKAGPVAGQCSFYDSTDIRRRAAKGTGVSGVIQGAAANAQDRVTNSPQSIADFEKHCTSDELSSKAIIQNCSIFIERNLLSGIYLAEAYNTRGVGYDEEGQTSLALSDYQRSIQLNPDQSNAHHNIATLYTNQGNLQLALKHLDEAIVRKPSTSGHLRRATVLLMLKRNQDAISDLDLVIRDNPENFGALYLRGVARKRIGNNTGGNEDLEKSRKLGESDRKVYDLVIRDFEARGLKP